MAGFIQIFSRRIIERMKADASEPLSDDKAQQTEETEKIMLKSAKSADKKLDDLEHEIEELKREMETIKNRLDS